MSTMRVGVLWLLLSLTAFPPARALAGPAPRAADVIVDFLRRGGTPRVEIVSPDRAETWVDGHTVRYVLLWDRRREMLLAQISFTNVHEVTWHRPRREETFSFYLPGIVRDAATGVFSTASGGVPVAAVQRRGLGAGSIQPTPGTTIYVTKPNGQVRVVLFATPGSPAVAAAPGDCDQRWRIQGIVGVL